MVKMKKNKLKELNKLAKRHKDSPTNKILKKKHNLEKKVTFQKELLLKETVKSNSLVNTVKSDILKNLPTKQEKSKQLEDKVRKPKPVEKKKRRQETQVNDTKLILSLMKKFNGKGEMGH